MQNKLHAATSRALVFFATLCILTLALGAIPSPAQAAGEPLESEQWYLNELNIPSLWGQTQGSGVLVAVLGTGADPNHPDVGPIITSGVDYSTGSQTPLLGDEVGMGSFMAGVIAARRNNIGIAGVAPQATILPVKVLDNFGETTPEILAAAIIYSVNQGARVIAMPRGLEVDSVALRNAVAYANQQGRVIVSTGGNVFPKYPASPFPASYDTVIAVNATDNDKQPYDGADPASYVDLAAPGQNILGPTRGGRYAEYWGSAPAVAQVAGIAALLLSKHPGLTPAQLLNTLSSTATKVREPGAGAGIVNPTAAFAKLTPPASPTPTKPRPPTKRPPATAKGAPRPVERLSVHHANRKKITVKWAHSGAKVSFRYRPVRGAVSLARWKTTSKTSVAMKRYSGGYRVVVEAVGVSGKRSPQTSLRIPAR